MISAPNITSCIVIPSRRPVDPMAMARTYPPPLLQTSRVHTIIPNHLRRRDPESSETPGRSRQPNQVVPFLPFHDYNILFGIHGGELVTAVHRRPKSIVYVLIHDCLYF